MKGRSQGNMSKGTSSGKNTGREEEKKRRNNER